MNIINPSHSARAVWAEANITLYRGGTKWPVKTETYLTEIHYSSQRNATNVHSGSALFTSTWPDASTSIKETTEGTPSLAETNRLRTS